MHMDIDPKELSQWLKSNIKWDRDSLSSELGVTKKTLYNWTSGASTIPVKHAAKIKAIMNDENLPSKSIELDRIILEMSNEQYDMYESCAKSQGMGLKEWFVHLADRAAEEDEQN